MCFTGLAPDLRPYAGGSVCGFVGLLRICSPSQVEGLQSGGTVEGRGYLRQGEQS